MSDSLRTLLEAFSTLARVRETAIEGLQSATGKNGTQFDLSVSAPNIDRSLAEIDSRIVSICELTGSIPPDTDDILIPKSVLTPLAKPLANITNQYQAIIDHLSNIESNGGPGNLDPAALTFQSANGQITLQAEPLFQTIWNASENLLGPLLQLLSIVGKVGQPEFSSAARAFTQALERLHSNSAKVGEVLRNAVGERAAVQKALEESKVLQTEIGRLKEESEKDRKTLAEYESEGTQKTTAIRTTSEQAEQLKKTVDSYQASFNNFQSQLAAREKSLKEGTERQNKFLASITEIQQKITELNEKAEGMLSGATVAGLASAYGNMRKELSDELRFARWAFYGSILLLIVSAIPLAVYVIPGLSLLFSLPTGEPAQTAEPTELLLQILGRAILLLPAAWLTKFAASRHAALFRLKEHYAYKYSVASSVDGFKKQAEPYKDAIAAATFFELMDNPARRMDAQASEERHPNPAMEWLMKKLGATHDGK